MPARHARLQNARNIEENKLAYSTRCTLVSGTTSHATTYSRCAGSFHTPKIWQRSGNGTAARIRT